MSDKTPSSESGWFEITDRPRFGVAYRDHKTAWKIAPYPLRATPGSAQKLIEWLQARPRFKAMEMRVVSVASLPN